MDGSKGEGGSSVVALSRIPCANTFIIVVSFTSLNQSEYLRSALRSGAGAPSGSPTAAASGGLPAASLVPGALSDTVQGLLRCVLDHNKFVQHAAITSIANLADTSMNDNKTPILCPFLTV